MKNEDAARVVMQYGGDILSSAEMQREKTFIQHGRCSVFDHSLSVALLCVKIAAQCRRWRIHSNLRALIRGALLHDYFLYDWHVPDQSHRWHGLRHAKLAAQNARRDFRVGKLEESMIRTHMFPVNLRPPRYRESVILCIADKICATGETVSGLITRFRERGGRAQ